MSPDAPFDLATFIALARRVGTDTATVEVKTAREKLPKDIAETVSAFANASGGTIVCGISEQDGFVPAEGFDAKSAMDSLSNVCHEKVEPPVRAAVDVEEFEGSPVVVAKIPETEPCRKPCYVKARTIYDGSFIRTGDGDRRLSRYEVDRLLEGGVQPTFDAQVVSGATVEELDGELLAGFLRRERANSPRIFGRLSDEDALMSMNVVARDQAGVVRPTLAGLMAFAVHPQRHFPRANVTFAVFGGTAKTGIAGGPRFLDSRTIDGPIPVMISEVLASLRRNMKVTSYIEGALRRDIPEYPEDVVREAVANALMHRDYSPEGVGAQVQVNMYADRLEVLNPGGLYGPVTVDTMGEYGVSASRNARLSRILESTPYAQGYAEGGFVVENKGSGYIQMQESLAAAGLPAAEPRDGLSAFSLTIYKRSEEVEAIALEDDPWDERGLGERDRLIMATLRVGTGLSSAKIAERVGLSRSSVLRRLEGLAGKGLVIKEGAGPTTSYRAAR